MNLFLERKRFPKRTLAQNSVLLVGREAGRRLGVFGFFR
jgi:hypothetical protein